MESKALTKGDSPVDVRKPTTRFTRNVLRSVIGNERANQAKAYISMAEIPDDKKLSLDRK
jgi:hypothetical protein